ncbi:hypothetical protein BH10PSE4_BH10PSE4_47700 [soil metagenome]
MRLLAPFVKSSGLAVSLVVGGLALGGVAALAAPQAASHAGAKTTILTGQWEYNTRFGPIPVGSDQHCLKPADVENFNRGLCLKRYTCDYQTRVVQDGKIELKGTWTDKKGRVAPVSAKGSYTPESFRLNVNGKTVNGIPMTATLSAKRLSATCTAS